MAMATSWSTIHHDVSMTAEENKQVLESTPARPILGIERREMRIVFED